MDIKEVLNRIRDIKRDIKSLQSINHLNGFDLLIKLQKLEEYLNKEKATDISNQQEC